MHAFLNDTDLWAAFKMGDEEAFHAIYQQHCSSLFDYGRRLVNDNESVKDGIHDLFVKLWNNKASLGAVKSIRPYLLVSLRSMLVNGYRKTGRVNLVANWSVHAPAFDLVFSVEAAYLSKEEDAARSKKLLEALNKLSARQKEVVYLRYYEGLDYDEIADSLGITVKASYKLAARGLQALKDHVGISTPMLIFLLHFYNGQTGLY